MNYKLIAMDFDGTLLSENKTVSKVNKEKLTELKNKGYIIVGVTARNLTSVQHVCDIQMFNYLIFNNGTYIYDVKQENGQYIKYLNRKVVTKLSRNFFDEASEIDFCTLGHYYVFKNKTINPDRIEINGIDDIKEEIARMNIFLKNQEENNKCKKFIEENFTDIDVFEMMDTDSKIKRKWLAINPKDINKFVGIQSLCKKLNIDTKNVIFFGDSTNDLMAIKNVGVGVAMGNAIDIVKENAKEVTLSNEENGIAVFLEKLESEK